MNYYYNGKKPSSKYSIASGCLIIIAISAIIFLIFSIDSLADLEGHYLQLFLVCIMGFSIFYNFFKKKGKLHTNRIEIINDYLSINNFKVPLKNITLDIYNVDNNFNRYHLWDSNGEFAIYSVFEDDLLKDNKSSFIKNTKFHEEISSTQNQSSVSVNSNNKTSAISAPTIKN